ncbi:MAG: hypothetical protein ACKVS8_08135 [Phycisphaerales bacterium]
MNWGTMRRSFSAVILGCSVLGAAGAATAQSPPPGPTLPPVGGQIVENASREMREVAARACHAMEERARAGTARLVQMKRDGASAEEIRAAGRGTVQNLTSIAQPSYAQIRAIRERAAAALRAAGAGEAMFRRLNEAAERNLRAIGDCLKITSAQIVRTVHRLTSPNNGGGGDEA